MHVAADAVVQNVIKLDDNVQSMFQPTTQLSVTCKHWKEGCRPRKKANQSALVECATLAYGF